MTNVQSFQLVCIVSHSHFLQISRELRQAPWGSAVSLYLKEGICNLHFCACPCRSATHDGGLTSSTSPGRLSTAAFLDQEIFSIFYIRLHRPRTWLSRESLTGVPNPQSTDCMIPSRNPVHEQHSIITHYLFLVQYLYLSPREPAAIGVST
jgi:hypothetical protein